MNRREKIRGLLPVLKNRQAVMDDTISDLKKNHGPTTCDSCTSPGCCYQKTMVQLAEALLIAQDLKTRKLDTPELRKRLLEAGKAMEATARPAWFEKIEPCVFLTDDKLCAIYEYRPAQCRTYYVVSSQENCQPPESLNIKQIDLRPMLLDELAHMTAMHTFLGFKETPDKMYMRSLPLAIYIALKLLEEPTREVLEKIPWPSAHDLAREPQ